VVADSLAGRSERQKTARKTLRQMLRAGLKMKRGWVADQPQHLAIAKTPDNSRPAAAGRGRHRRTPGFSDTRLAQSLQ